MMITRHNCDDYVDQLRAALPNREIHARRFTNTSRVQILVSAVLKPPYLPCELVETTERAEELLRNRQ